MTSNKFCGQWLLRFFLTACFYWVGISQGIAITPQTGGTLIYRATDEIQDLDPAAIEDSATFNIAGNIFEGLVRYQGETAIIEPALAHSWQVSENGLLWTFFLRKDVIFHDNSALNAEAVLFSFLRQKDSNHPFYKAGFLKDVLFAQVKEIRIKDEYLIEFELLRPYSPFLHVLTMPPAAIISPGALKKNPKEFGRAPVGTGPFQVSEWTENEFILEPFERYWGNSPKLERVVVQPAKFLKNMLLSMRQNNLHLAVNVTPQELLWVQGDREIRVKKIPANQVSFFAFNMDRKIFQDRRIRIAMQHILNKEALVHWLWQGNAVAANSPIPPTNWSFKALEGYPRDFEKAKSLLKKAGYEKGLKLQLLVPVRRDPSWPRFFKSFILACRAVGIQVELQSLSFGDYLKAIVKQDFDLVWLTWATDHADPDGFIWPLLHSVNADPKLLSNLAFYKNPALDRLIDRAQQEIKSRERRTEYYHRIQDLLHEESPLIPLMIPNTAYLHHRLVHNVQVSVTGRILLENIWMESE
ncbi:MAG: hypothetical protein HQM13_17325 [SAR324 cluster bacterium]|nr:hypothetical protein [SAR324 cluster bacterium]